MSLGMRGVSRGEKRQGSRFFAKASRKVLSLPNILILAQKTCAGFLQSCKITHSGCFKQLHL